MQQNVNFFVDRFHHIAHAREGVRRVDGVSRDADGETDDESNEESHVEKLTSSDS